MLLEKFCCLKRKFNIYIYIYACNKSKQYLMIQQLIWWVSYCIDAVAIRDKQLKELQEFIENYCKEKRPRIPVLFSILCGQLGFDNKSSGWLFLMIFLKNHFIVILTMAGSEISFSSFGTLINQLAAHSIFWGSFDNVVSHLSQKKKNQ